MLPGLEMLSCPNLAVPAEVMQHVVHVESSHNPFAIGVVGGQLVRQPQNLDEAVATARMLEQQDYDFSVGIAQVNRANLGKYGLDTYEKAFDACANLAAGSRILAECYTSAGNDWGKAFSCYYSGNFTTGYRDGYVQKVYDSIGRSLTREARQAVAIPISAMRGYTAPPANGSAYRVAMRSLPPDNAASGGVTPGAAGPADLPAKLPQADGIANHATAVVGNTVANDIFVPQVRGPNDPAPSAAAPPTPVSAPAPTAADSTDQRQGTRDEAFVF